MDIQTQIQQSALKFFLGILHSSASDQAPFKALITVEIDGEHKPLLLVGIAHSRVEDGHVLAVLNPDQELCERFVAGCAYTHGTLREIVALRCDLALFIWIDAYQKVKPVKVFTKYVAEKARSAKFAVR